MMPTTEEYINSLKNDKDNLVIALHEKGVEADFEEPFTSLVSKVSDITPNLQERVVYPDEIYEVEVEPDIGYDGLSKVTVMPIPDEYIIPILQDKEVTPSKLVQEVTADGEFTGLNKVTVDAIGDEYVIPTGNLDVVENGDFDVTEYASVNVNVQTKSWKEELIDLIDNKGANVKQLPDELTEIGYYGLAYREDMVLDELPNGLKSIGGYGLRSCVSLDLTKFPDSIETIGSNACRGCTNLALTELPKNLKTMGTYAFAECDKLAVTEIPKGVTLLDQYLFYNSKGLTLMVLHENIETLNQRVFYGCENLREVDIRNLNITSLAGYTFYNCSSLVALIIRAKNPPILATSTLTNTPIAKGTGYFYVPDEEVLTYQNTTNYSRYASQILPLSEYKGELLI